MKRVGLSLLGGILCGAVVGGLGGRLAMFVLRLTSDDRIIGLQTDDDFTIGSFTSSTIFLVFFCSFFGFFAGGLYAIGSGFIPAEQRLGFSGAIYGLAGGALLLKPGEFDFTAVDPPILTVVFFVLLPALFGAALSWLVERWANDDFELQGLTARAGRAVLAVTLAFCTLRTLSSAIDIV